MSENNNFEIIYDFLKETKKPYCDDCLSKFTKVTPRQQINSICNTNQDKINKVLGKCSNCKKVKITRSVKNEENLGTGEFGNGTGSLADRIRLYCVANKIEPARKLKATNVTISASDIHKEMNLSNRFPAVCQVLSGKKFQELANIKIVREIGDNPSSRYAVVYEIL